jgi:hypothetical protein
MSSPAADMSSITLLGVHVLAELQSSVRLLQ